MNADLKVRAGISQLKGPIHIQVNYGQRRRKIICKLAHLSHLIESSILKESLHSNIFCNGFVLRYAVFNSPVLYGCQGIQEKIK